MTTSWNIYEQHLFVWLGDSLDPLLLAPLEGKKGNPGHSSHSVKLPSGFATGSDTFLAPQQRANI